MTPAENKFLQLAVPAARLSMCVTGVPASVTIAQAIDESGWGNHAPGNNYFGIKDTHKVHPDSYTRLATHECVDGRLVEIEADFLAFPDASACFTAHAKLLAEAPRYRPAMQHRDDALEFARQLYVCGYATDSSYPRKLALLIRDYDLTQYDHPPSAPATQAAA